MPRSGRTEVPPSCKMEVVQLVIPRVSLRKLNNAAAGSEACSAGFGKRRACLGLGFRAILEAIC